MNAEQLKSNTDPVYKSLNKKLNNYYCNLSLNYFNLAPGTVVSCNSHKTLYVIVDHDLDRDCAIVMNLTTRKYSTMPVNSACSYPISKQYEHYILWNNEIVSSSESKKLSIPVDFYSASQRIKEQINYGQ